MTIMASLAQQESESLSANVRLGLQLRYQQGKVQVNHNWFLGYTKDEDGHLIIDQEQAEVVKRIYREYLSGNSILKIKRTREANKGQVPKYYVEGSHEGIIPKDIFLKAQEEIARRSNLTKGATPHKRVYSSRYALSGIVFCAHCGDIYRRIKWNNRGCKSTVWRCVSRVDKDGPDCTARTVREEHLHEVAIEAINGAFREKKPSCRF